LSEWLERAKDAQQHRADQYDLCGHNQTENCTKSTANDDTHTIGTVGDEANDRTDHWKHHKDHAGNNPEDMEKLLHGVRPGAEQMIKQVWISSHFGVISKRPHACDGLLRLIKQTLAPTTSDVNTLFSLI
jgi:hypothetical protein